MKTFDWVVIGAGPAGIASIGKLLGAGVEAQSIAWIDPAFAVGDFGTKWRNVPSNTSVELFQKYLSACVTFNYSGDAEDFVLNRSDPKQTCLLHLMAEPLVWVTQQLMKKVSVFKNTATTLSMVNNFWQVTLENTTIRSKNIILAIGAEPKTLSYPNIETIPLDIALDGEQMIKTCNPETSVAVFGASHSAVLIIKNLVETCRVKKVINFYRDALRYAIPLSEDEYLFDDTGLKGTTAEWARKHLHGTSLQNVERIYASPENIQSYLSHCQKAVYAIGFERRSITITDIPHISYNPHNGIIAPGLFGIGIAFPEEKIDQFGNREYRVGLWKFMDYLTTILPIWMKYSL